MRYWVFVDHRLEGPLERAELARVAGFSRETLVCPEGASPEAGWVAAGSREDLRAAFGRPEPAEEPPGPGFSLSSWFAKAAASRTPLKSLRPTPPAKAPAPRPAPPPEPAPAPPQPPRPTAVPAEPAPPPETRAKSPPLSAALRSDRWKPAALTALLDPRAMTQEDLRLPITLPVLTLGTALLAAALGAAPYARSSFLGAAAGLLAAWSAAVGGLVICCSISGIGLGWRDGARLAAWSCLPLLLKGLCAAVFALATTLDPFLFSAGPRLLLRSASFWLARLDLFELWAALLLRMFLARETGRSDAAVTAAALSAWAGAAIVLGLASLAPAPGP